MTEKRLIDANALLSQINDPKGLIILDGRAALVSGEWEGLRRQKDVIAAVEASPIVDAVPVVRCKDCKYYVPHTDYTWCANTMRCNHPELTFDIKCYDHWLDVGPEDFCSRGERRDGGAVDGI